MKNFYKTISILLYFLVPTFSSLAQVTGGSFTGTCTNTGTANWTNGTNTTIIFAKATSAVTVGTPNANIATITANPAFGSGDAYQNDAAAFCVYKGTGTSVNITGLSPGVTYHFLAFDATGTTYSAAHTFNGPTLSTPPNGSSLIGTSGNGQVALSWSNPACMDEILVVAKPTSTIAGTPTGDGTSYTADADFGGAGSTFDTTGKVVYKNTSNSVTVTGLTNGTTYFFRVYTRKGTTWSAGIEISAIPYAPVSGGTFNTNICLTTGTASWTNPATVGTVIIFAKAGGAITEGTATNNISAYTADANFSGSGTAYENDASAKCVYKGTGNSVNLTGLTVGTTYHFLVFNASGTSYSSSHTFNGPTLTTPPNVTGLGATPSTNSVDLVWSNPACFDEVLIVAKTTTVGGTPSGDGTAYTADSNFGGAGTTFDTSGKVVYKGTGTTVTVTGLSVSTMYFFRVYTRKGTTWSAGNEVSTTTVCTPTNVTAVKVSDAATTANLYWTDPSCFDEFMIVAKQGTASTIATISVAPTGDGTSYTANPSYTGGGSAFDGGKVVFKSGTNPGAGGFQVTNLTTGLIYTFKIFTRKGTTWSAGTTITTVPGPPVLISASLVPADGSTGVQTDQVFSATFNEKIYISHTTAASTDDDIEFDPSSGTSQFIARGAGSPSIVITGKTIDLTPSGGLTELNTTYNILIGNKVLTDSTGNVSGAGGGVNDFVGTVAGNWNFITSAGVNITAPTVGTCINQFTPLGNIVITESADNNFQGTDNGTFTLVLGFDKTGYIFNPGTSGVTAVPAGGGDIQSVTVTSVTFTQATFTIQFSNVANDALARNDPDQITISGLKVSRDGSMAPPAIIVAAAATDLPIQGLTEGTTLLATINGGSVPTAPTITYPAGDNSYCINATFSGISITASDPDGPVETFNWYNDAALTSVNAINANSRTVEQLIGASPAAGTYTRYATQVDGCESVATTVTIIITPLPVASAGPNLIGGNAVCSGATVILGGSPTATGGTGSYTYAWTGPGSPAAVSNPNHVMVDPGGSDQIYNFQVTVTDGNGCSSTTATKQVEVKNLSEAVVITQPNTFTYTTNNQPVVLAGSPTGGAFSGVGVIQLNGSYQFDPELAGIGTWPITYTTTLTNGCTKSVVQNFDVTTPYDVFPALEAEYCNNEGSVSLAVSGSMLTEIQNYIDTWNNVYVPNYGYAPLKPTWTGIIRNEYEIYYGDNNSVVGSTFYPSALLTDQAYPPGGGIYGACPTCTYAYIAVFIEFASPLNTYPYNISAGQDYGYVYNNGTIAALEYRGEFVYINPVPQVSFSGLLSSYCNINTDYQLTGNKPGGEFEISSDGTNFADDVNPPDPVDGIKDFNEGMPAGIGEFNPLEAVGGIVSTANRWIRYSVDPGTTGSTGQGCVGRQVQFTNVHPATPITFPGSVPANNTQFCYEGTAIDIVTSAGAPPGSGFVTYSGFGISDNGNGSAKFTPQTAFEQKNPSSTNPETMTITATYTNAQGCSFPLTRDFIVRPKPTSSYTVTDPTIPGTPPDLNFCYNDPPLTLQGNQPASSTLQYFIDYINLGYTQTITNDDMVFDPAVYFDDYDARGGSNVSDATFTIRYVVTDGLGCTASSSKIFAVSPLAEITISGINDGDRFCSNTTPFPVTFAPINGTLEVNNIITPLNPTTNSISSANIPIGNAVTLEYEYQSGVSQCVTTLLYTISKVDAPTASFTTTPTCDGDPATFTAGPDPNNYSWKWVLGDSIRSGTDKQTINHVFPGLSQGATQTSYLIKLIIDNEPTALLACKDSTEAVQVIGAYPQVDFNYADVCEGNFTRFTITSNIPIASAQWDFDDSFSLPNQPLNSTISGGDTHGGLTQGTYGQPEHQFAFTPGILNRYAVQLTGRTAPNVGACPDVITRQVAILEGLTPTPATPYYMVNEGAGNGLWIEEDRSGLSTWEFATPGAGKTNMTNTVGNVWITNANGPYNATDDSFMNSPCFDLSAFTKPVFSLQYWSSSDVGKDGAILQYSINGGQTWEEIGTATSGINWYSNTTISSAPGNHNQFGWTGRFQQQWLTGKNSLDVVAGQTNVRFRVAFASDEREEYDGFAFNNVVIEERNRIMLLEHFANVDTDNTAIGASIDRFNTHAPLNDAEIVKIQYHTSYPDPDPINSANSADHNARAAYYGVTNQTIPVGFIDGGRDLSAPLGFASPVNPGNGWWNDFKQKRSLNSSPYILSVVSEPSASLVDELTVHVTGTRIAAVPGSKPVLHVGIIEKDFTGFEHIMRKLLPDASGTPLDPMALTIDETFVWRAEGVADLSDLAIIAFIQDEITKEIHQADIDLNPTNLPTGPVTDIEDPTYASQINFYPNPANHEVNIVLPAEVTKSTPVLMFDSYGKAVHESTFNPGQRKKTISTTELAGGVYIVQLTSPSGQLIRKKVMVVH